MKLYKNDTIYYFCKGWVGADKVLNVRKRKGLPKSNKCKHGERGVQILVIL